MTGPRSEDRGLTNQQGKLKTEIGMNVAHHYISRPLQVRYETPLSQILLRIFDTFWKNFNEFNREESY